MIPSLLFVAMNASLLIVAFAVATALMPRMERWRVAAATIAAFVLLASGLVLALGLLGLLRVPIVTAFVVAAALFASLRHKPGLLRRRPRPAALALWRRAPTEALASLLVLALMWGVSATLGGLYISVDDQTYHATHAAHWLVAGEISTTAYTYQSYFPLNGELLCLWFMLPFGSDALVGLTGFVYAALFGTAAVGALRAAGAGWGAALLAPVAVLSSTRLLGYVATFADVDFGGPALFVAAVCIGAPATGGDKRDAPWGRAALAGALVGFAVGMKVSFAPVGLVLTVALALLARSRGGTRAALGTLAVVVFAALLAGGYWYARNLALTGNPFYPAQLGLFDGPFQAADQTRTTMLHVLRTEDASTVRRLLAATFDWPRAHAVVLGAGALTAAILHARSELPMQPFPRFVRLVLLVMALVSLLLLPMLPFSGRNELGALELNGARYLFLPLLASAMLTGEALSRLCARLPAAVARIALAVVLGVLLVPLALRLSGAERVVVVALVAAVAVGRSVLSLRATLAVLAPARRPALVVVAASLAVAAVAVAAPLSIGRTDARLLKDPLVAALEELPRGSRVASFTDHDGYVLRMSYPLFGRRLQLVPVPLLADALPAEPLHNLLRAPGTETFWDFAELHDRPVPSVDVLLTRLREARVDFVVTAPSRVTGEWPEHHRLLLLEPSVTLVHKVATGAIWAVGQRQREPSDGARVGMR